MKRVSVKRRGGAKSAIKSLAPPEEALPALLPEGLLLLRFLLSPFSMAITMLQTQTQKVSKNFNELFHP
jgi:hypothetical protein